MAPCILPMLPLVLGGSLSGGSKARPFVIVGSLMASIVVFTLLLKATTALLGLSPVVWQVASGSLIIGLGLLMIFPRAWSTIVARLGFEAGANKAVGKHASEPGFLNAILTGAALGPVFSSCSPTYALIIAVVLPRSFTEGFVYLMAYVIGIGAVMLPIAFFGQKIIGRLQWATNPSGWFRRGLGVLFIVVGVMVATGLDKELEILLLDRGLLDPTGIEQQLMKDLQ